MYFYGKIILLLSVLCQKSFSYECSDDWHLVTLPEGPVCWALLDVPDFSTDYTGALNLCEATKSGGAEIRSSAEKATLAELATKPALTCYRGYQSSVIDKSKSFDYEKPPKYLSKLNSEGIIKLGKGIQKGDRIIVGFSVRSENSSDSRIGGRLKIGKSLELKFEIDNEKKKKSYSFKHDGLDVFNTVELASESQLISDEYLGVIAFDFLDKRISFLDTQLDIPSNFTFIGNVDIFTDNLIVSSIQHSKICPGTPATYQFDRKSVSNERSEMQSDRYHTPRTLGTNFRIPVPQSFFDFHRTFAEDQAADNPIIFDIKIGGIGWKSATVTFINKNLSIEVLKITLRQVSDSEWSLIMIGLNEDGVKVRTSNEVADPRGMTSVRLSITSSIDTMVVKSAISSSTEHKDLDDPLEAKNHRFHEISFQSDSALFYDVHLKPLSEVVVSTCNFRSWQLTDDDETVPYQEKCDKKRNILCQRQPSLGEGGATGEPNVRNETGWKEGMTAEVEDLDSEKKGEIEMDKSEEEKKKVEIRVEILNIKQFRWCIIGLTSGSALLFVSAILFIIF